MSASSIKKQRCLRLLIIIKPGILEITPYKPAITIKTGSDSVYDGTSRCDEWSLDEGKLLPGHELSVVVTGKS